MALRELQIVVLIALVAVLLALANPARIAQAELQADLEIEWAQFYAVTGGRQ